MKPQGILSTVTLLALNLASCTAGLWGSSSSSNGAAAANEATPEAPPFKHDYKMSFKKPFYYNGTVPFWKTGGAVIQADDFIRLAPSVPNTKGWIWSDNTNPYESWEVEVAFKVTGNQMHGGRGLAFWYTKDKMIDGPIFGARDQWDGLSIWLDSANPKTHTPTTMVLLNDGTRAFATNTDPTKYMLGSCSMNYRNTVIPSYLKVAYKDGTLTVALDTNGQGSDYRVCVQRSGIKLPSGYYFGLSVIPKSDIYDHDVISWETKQLNPPAKAQKYKRPLEDEKIRQGEEFRELSDAQKKGAIYDTQRRALENLQMVQLQIEALGAPPLQDILEGKVEKRTGGSGVQTTM
ncbi:legume-like lectin family-domain-containing protein [Radiomyces spectabilis]|uniref:legume-like lectin family-domain-containing protein n=1 Tax=Radiomyces spectabilis TaxID=64574 RepID=UPI00221E9594|nr:legume-like lectin family-domain-containing protein [Radiomyces spectabilis]KAI8380926.1 legume-like lectin family-domain-containing protein [Radiomyces spectabilis]